jgi:PBP1b-binding outer membrane lipoprotein LpoB
MKKYLLGLISTLLLIGCGQSDPVKPQVGKSSKETKDSKDSNEPPAAPKHYME